MLRGEEEREHRLPASRAVGCRTGCEVAEQVPCHNEVRVGSADASGRALRDLAGPHEAVLAADAGHAEDALRLLAVKAVKDGLDAAALHVEKHLAHSGIRRLLDLLLLVREGPAVGADCRGVVRDIHLVMMVVMALVVMSVVVIMVMVVMVLMVMVVIMVMLMIMLRTVMCII